MQPQKPHNNKHNIDTAAKHEYLYVGIHNALRDAIGMNKKQAEE